MKIVIFGATGSIGRHLVSQALAANHHVTAFARKPQMLQISHPNLTLFNGDVYHYDCVVDAIKNKDCVLITLGSKKLTGKVRSVGTRNIVQAMQQQKVKRLICQTTLGMGESYAVLNFYWKFIMFGLLLRAVFNDHKKQEAIVKNSSLDWTIVRPSAFNDNNASKDYRSGFLNNDKNLQLSISRKNVAHFMLQQVKENTYIKQSPGISN